MYKGDCMIKFQPLPKYNIKLIVKEDEKHLWKFFAKHHYMTCDLPVESSFPSSAKMFTFYWVIDDTEILIGCLGVLFQIASYPAKRLTRVVVLPEFQGLGFSSKMINSISDYYTSQGFKVYGATYHPRLGKFREKSNNWVSGMYNQREFKLSENHNEKSMSGLRDGEMMYRHYYTQNKDYILNYDPYKISTLKKQIKEIENNLTESNIKEYKELRKELKDIYAITGDTLEKEKVLSAGLLSDDENKKYKESIKRNKRKVLTSDERKLLKAIK